MYDDINTPYESIVSLGEAFAKYRKSLKISQQRLHEMTGISIFTISQFENGKGQGLSLSHFLLLSVRLIRKRCGCHKIRKEVENEWECSKSRVVG